MHLVDIGLMLVRLDLFDSCRGVLSAYRYASFPVGGGAMLDGISGGLRALSITRRVTFGMRARISSQGSGIPEIGKITFIKC